MITIQSGMLIALGFLAAVLLGLLVAPALWRRAVRLTTHRIKMSVPLSESEIEADRDRIRAEYAIKMHKLEMLVEQVKLAGARQQIEINRRDARVNMLEADLEKLRGSYEEAQNARHVLEQTIAARLPRVEARLAEAKTVLTARERELGEMTATSEKQVEALAVARQMDDHNRQEIVRLNGLLSSKMPAGEARLRDELQSLKAKAREQAELIDKLQSRASRFGKASAAVRASAGGEADAAVVARQAELERELSTLRSENEDQAAEIAKLKAALEVFERNAESEMLGSVRESRLALKAKVQAHEAQLVQQSETVAKLRGELAAANERLALQAAQFTDELKRLSTADVTGARRSSSGEQPRASLAERIARASASSNDPAAPAETTTADGATEVVFVPDTASVAQADADAPRPAKPVADDKGAGSPGGGSVSAAPQPSEVASEPEKVTARRAAKRASTPARPRLLDRIAGLSRTS